MNFFALLMSTTLAITSFIFLFIATGFVALSFSDVWALWPELKKMESRFFVVAIVLYVLILVGSWIYTDKKKRRLNPRYRIRWDSYVLVLIVLPFFLSLLASYIPENLFLMVLFLVLLCGFYEAVKAQQEVVYEEEKIEMAPVSQQ